MSAVGTTLLHSPGGNEGKVRYATLGKHRQKRIELRRSGTTEHSFGLCHCWVAVGGVPLLKELKGYRKRLTQGFAGVSPLQGSLRKRVLRTCFSEYVVLILVSTRT